jgi:hypothetical protein
LRSFCWSVSWPSAGFFTTTVNPVGTIAAILVLSHITGNRTTQ